MTDLLCSALQPRCVAIIGASDNIHKIGGRPIHYMQRHGFAGRIYPINPQRTQVQGLHCYASLAALPEVPDLALVAVGGEHTLAAVEQCAQAGVKSVVVIASGFGETGPAGIQLQQHMAARARAAGMRLFGPNTQGLANFGNGAIAGFSTMFLEVPPLDGPVAIVSQSGGMCAMAYGLLRGQGLGVRHVHATGNEADVSAAELAWAVAHDPDMRLLLLYLEHISDPEMLAATAAYARERDLPIIAVKAGRSAQGQMAAASHTGALANEDRTVDAFFRHHGIWRVRDPHEQVRAAQAYLKGWRPQGRRLVIISNSGASCVMAADAAADHGLPLAALAPQTRAALAAKLPGFATTDNPIDITSALLGNSGLLGDVLPAVASDPAADLFFLNIPVAGVGYDVQAFARDALAFEQQSGKPLAVAAWQSSVAAPFRAQGIATFDHEGDALAVLAQLAQHTALMRRPRPHWKPGKSPLWPAPGQSVLNEAQSLDLLRQHGIATIGFAQCHSSAQVQAAFARIGAPVALKACSFEVPHKSEHGLVALHVHSSEQALQGFGRMMARMEQMGVCQQGVIVAAMHKGRHEFMVGAHLDPVFGPVVVVGDGGKHVEALQDCAVLLPPFDSADVLQALRGLHIAALLDGVRGDPPLDLQAVAEIAIAVGRLMLAAEGAITSIDLNPVMVGAVGEPTLVVDALVLGAAGPAAAAAAAAP